MIRLVLLIVILAGVGLLLFLGMLIAPRVDEHIGFFTVRATEAVQSYRVDGVPLSHIIDNQFQAVRWRAFHQDIPFQTFVECVGTPRSGGGMRHMLWYVEERATWDRGPSLMITVMTALNKDALQLTPHLFDPRAGYLLEYWRHGVELP
jgi:hypothetical protein